MARRRRPKLRAPEALDRVLARAGEDRFAKNRAPVTPHAWAAAVGARIAERTRPIAMEDGVLVVRAATSVWANELTLLSETLVARLRSAGVPVKGMRFRVGPIDPPDRAVEVRRATVPRPQPLDGKLERAIDAVDDEELRAAIAEAARTNLAWQTASEPVPPREGVAVRAPTAAPRDARGPRDAGRGSDPPGRTSPAGRGAWRGTRGDD